jgi:hypothetical protein
MTKKRRRTNKNLTLSCSLTGSKTLQDSTTAQRNQLLADLCAAEVARQGAVTRKTHEDQARAWRRWIQWTKSIGLEHDIYLDGFSKHQRIKLIGVFAMALRQARFSGPAYDTLVESTVRSTISFMAQTFRECDRPNPTKDEDGELGRLLSRQYRSFRNKDPSPSQQKSSPNLRTSQTIQHDIH